MTHSAQGLSRGGHSVEAGELRKQLFYRQGNGGFAKLMTAQSQRQQRRSQDTNPGSLALGTGHRPSPPAASLTDDTRRGEGHPAVPPRCPEMPLQGPSNCQSQNLPLSQLTHGEARVTLQFHHTAQKCLSRALGLSVPEPGLGPRQAPCFTPHSLLSHLLASSLQLASFPK